MSDLKQNLIDLYTKAYNICVEREIKCSLLSAVYVRINRIEPMTVEQAINDIINHELDYCLDRSVFDRSVFEKLASIDPDTYEPYNEMTGICSNLLVDEPSILVNSLMVTWEKFSGRAAYPVPNADALALDFGTRFEKDEHGVLTAEGVYDYHSKIYRNQWDKKTQYGRDRYELLAHIVNTCKALLGE